MKVGEYALIHTVIILVVLDFSFKCLLTVQYNLQALRLWAEPSQAI